ncbi:MAG: hypothetical protein L0Y67_05555 [Gammaproteobacteria bacterium]|nr:hypothetical protein [Gammaproteobacteria bacterium]MCI0591053.1 hypothetical protein [Gammaproteobacteria bacterium]
MRLMAKLRALGINMLVLCASMAFTLLVLEVLEGLVRILRLDAASKDPINSFCEYNEYLGWKLIPNTRTIFKGKHHFEVDETSQQGLRDCYYPAAREPGRHRILVLGDPFAWYWGVAQNECFTESIERRLADTDVINTSVPGYSTQRPKSCSITNGKESSSNRIWYCCSSSGMTLGKI